MRTTLCLALASVAVWFRRLAGLILPDDHPLRDFENDMVALLQGAEREWFHSSKQG